jgi:hypothetical protein
MQSTLKSASPFAPARPKIGRPPAFASATVLPLPVFPAAAAPAVAAPRPQPQRHYLYMGLAALALMSLVIGFQVFSKPGEKSLLALQTSAAPASDNGVIAIQSPEGSLVGSISRIDSGSQEMASANAGATIGASPLNGGDRKHLLSILSKD